MDDTPYPSPILHALLAAADQSAADAASTLHAVGLQVLPLAPHSKVPAVSQWAAWQSVRQTGGEVAAMWHGHPEYGVGVITGALSGLVVLDLDRHDGVDGYVAAREAGLDVPATYCVRSPSGGIHCYYLHPGRPVQTRAAVRGLRGVDVRGDGGYIVAPPTAGYVPLLSDATELAAIAPCPAWLQAATPAQSTGGAGAHPLNPADSALALLGMPCPEGQRNDTAARIAGALAHYGVPEASAAALLRQWAGMQCEPALPAAEAAAVVHSIYATHARAAQDDAPPAAPPAQVASSITPTPLRWLWPGRLAATGMHLLYGHGGAGKTWLACALAAAVSRGAPWPDGGAAAQGAVIYCVWDRLDETDRVVERLQRVGADLTRIHLLAFDVRSIRESLLARLHETVDAVVPRLVIVDSITSLMQNGDSLNPQPLLMAIHSASSASTSCVINIGHKRKAPGGAAESVAGSQRLTSYHAQVLMAGAHPDDPERRGLAVVSTRYSAAPPTWPYAIDDAQPSLFAWGAMADAELTADVMSRGGGVDRRQIDRVREVIRALLADGPMPSAEFEEALRAHGISSGTANRAREGLVIAERDPARGTGRVVPWRVRLVAPSTRQE